MIANPMIMLKPMSLAAAGGLVLYQPGYVNEREDANHKHQNARTG
jgi:hypothetical protein